MYLSRVENLEKVERFSLTGNLCESTERMTKRIAEQMSREDAMRALQNLIEIDKDIHSQMDILRERIWPGNGAF